MAAVQSAQAAAAATRTPAPPTPPAAFSREHADQLIKTAQARWEEKNFEESIAAAEMALAIYKQHLKENDPKILQVQAMIEAARKQAAAAKP